MVFRDIVSTIALLSAEKKRLLELHNRTSKLAFETRRPEGSCEALKPTMVSMDYKVHQ